MNYNYKTVPPSIRKADLFSKKSLSSKDYSLLNEGRDTVKLGQMVNPIIGDIFTSKNFLTKDICDKYRFIKTGNLVEDRLSLDFSSTQYCKPVGTDCLEDEDILVAKDGGKGGLGETSIYFKNNNRVKDFICGEILRLRVKKQYDKWYLLSILKSQHFKDYLDIVTPEGSTLRHSKLLSLDYAVPFPKDQKYVEFVSMLTQNLVDKELQLKTKIKKIDEIFFNEIHNNCIKGKLKQYKLPRKDEIMSNNRIDTGIYSKEYVSLVDKIFNYCNGYYYLTEKHVKPGKTPDDYKYTNEKRDDSFLWVTPKNINTLELLFETYIHTREKCNTRDYSIILSGIRYLGYGYMVEKDQKVYSNQNTLVVNYSSSKDEQIFLLAFFTSTIGKILQYAWRVDGLVPIIYKDDFVKIPVPKFEDSLKKNIVQLYYNVVEPFDYKSEDYLKNEKARNKKLGIYQLNQEIISLRRKINQIIHLIITDNEQIIKLG